MSSFSSTSDVNLFLIDQYINNGDYGTVLVAFQKGFIITKEIVKECILSGNKELYSYLYLSHIPVLTIEMMNIAVSNGNLDTFKRLHHFKCPWDWSTFKDAAKLGNLT